MVFAEAQVFKCTDERGRLSFSDKPCAGGGGEELSQYSDGPTVAVEGSATRNEINANYIDGFAYWRQQNTELVAVLLPRALAPDEIEAIERGSLANLQQWRELGIAEITFLFDEPPPGRNTVEHMRSVFTGFEPSDPRIPWTSNHDKTDFRYRLVDFELLRDGLSRPWLRAKTAESTEFIEWELEFTVRVLQ
ncbi:MAG: DUF4124 domain-containing protein [Gammaproteobacteria bacterium]